MPLAPGTRFGPFEISGLASGKSRVLYGVRLASMSPGLSVLPDGKTVLVSGVAVITSDLIRMENFR